MFKTIKKVLKNKGKTVANGIAQNAIPTALGSALATFNGGTGVRDGYIAGKTVNYVIKKKYEEHKNKKAKNNEKV